MISLWTVSRPPSSAVDSVMELNAGAIFDHGEAHKVLNFLPLRWIQGRFESRAWVAHGGSKTSRGIRARIYSLKAMTLGRGAPTGRVSRLARNLGP